jgi:hypothetical protein
MLTVRVTENIMVDHLRKNRSEAQAQPGRGSRGGGAAALVEPATRQILADRLSRSQPTCDLHKGRCTTLPRFMGSRGLLMHHVQRRRSVETASREERA